MSDIKNKYVIRVEETLCKDMIVEAYSTEEAMAIVEDAYHDGALILDSNDFVECQISDTTDLYEDYILDGKYGECTINLISKFEDILK